MLTGNPAIDAQFQVESSDPDPGVGAVSDSNGAVSSGSDANEPAEPSSVSASTSPEVDANSTVAPAGSAGQSPRTPAEETSAAADEQTRAVEAVREGVASTPKQTLASVARAGAPPAIHPARATPESEGATALPSEGAALADSSPSKGVGQAPADVSSDAEQSPSDRTAGVTEAATVATTAGTSETPPAGVTPAVDDTEPGNRTSKGPSGDGDGSTVEPLLADLLADAERPDHGRAVTSAIKQLRAPQFRALFCFLGPLATEMARRLEGASRTERSAALPREFVPAVKHLLAECQRPDTSDTESTAPSCESGAKDLFGERS